jgi:hypothetical protein
MAYGQQAGMRLPTEVKRYYEGDLWSTHFFADAAPLASLIRPLYSVAIGGTGQGFGAVSLDIAHTNMEEAGRIASGLAYTVRQVGIECCYDDNWGICRADLQNVRFYCVPTWKFLNTEVPIAPVSLIGEGGGIFGSTADTGGAEGGLGGSRMVLNNGAGQTWCYYELPVLLPANTTFSLRLMFGALATVVDGGLNNSDLLIRAHLIGVVTSAVPQG